MAIVHNLHALTRLIEQATKNQETADGSSERNPIDEIFVKKINSIEVTKTLKSTHSLVLTRNRDYWSDALLNSQDAR